MQPSLRNSDSDIIYGLSKCSLGYVLVATSDQEVCGIFLGNDVEAVSTQVQNQFPGAREGADAQLRRLVNQVESLVEAPPIDVDLPLDIRGTVFQRQVWQAIREIPGGATVSYGDVAPADWLR